MNCAKMKKAQLIEEIEALQERIAELERAETERKRAEEALERRSNELAALYDTALDVTAQLGLPQLLHTIVERATDLLKGYGGALYLHRPEHDDLELVLVYGLKPDFTGSVLKRGEGVSGKVLESGQPMIVGDYRTWSGRAPIYEGAPFEAVIAVPVKWGEQVLGIINVLGEPGAGFNEEDARLLALFANEAAVALENARLYESVQQEPRERKRAEEALRESEEKYRLLVENATVTIVVAQDGMLKFFNPKAMEITGYSQEELASQPFTELIHPDDLEVTIGYYLKFLQGEETPPFHTFRIIDKEGSIKWLESNAVLITWEDSPATLNFLSDITERKQAEDALWESEAKYRSLTDDVLDSSAVGVFILDSDFRIVWVNQALERYFSIRSDEIVGKDKRQLIHERIADIFQDPENFAEKVLATYDNNTYIENFECHVLSDGECKERWLEHWSQPIRSGLYAGGRIEHYYDITERKEAEELLREHVRQIERLNDLFVGREQRMIELKKEVNSLLKKLGQPPKYEVPAEVDRLRREFEEKPGQ